MIEHLAEEGKKHLLIVPISFVSDHIETSFELDIEYREVADEARIENYIVMYGLNDSETFIEALTDLVKEKLEESMVE
jgi:ferrochelatase